MRWEDFRPSDYVEDRRGQSGGGGFGLPIPGARGGLGFGTLIIVGILAWALGIDPRILIQGAEIATGGKGPATEHQAPAPSKKGAPADQIGRFAASILGNTEDVWKQVLPAQMNRQYSPAGLVLYTRGTRSGCGLAQSAMGPFYCPLDRKVYLDTSFFQEMERKFGTGGDFAYAYVIAHEVGHHVQNVLGILPKVQRKQQEVGEVEANQLSVRVELMADCLAGVWARNSNDRFNAITEADIRQAVAAAQAIGDDRLQKRSQGEAIPDTFTHGTSEQRVRWLLKGFKSGQVQSCDTFRASYL